MQHGPEAKFQTSWASVREPSQRFIADKAKFGDVDVPLQLNVYGSDGYAEKVVKIIKDLRLPVYKFTHRNKPQRAAPVSGVFAFSDFSRVAEGTDAVFFGQNPVAQTEHYHQALNALVAATNRTLVLQQLDPIPPPPKMQKKTPDQMEEADSA